MADDVVFTLGADATPPANTIAATDETTSGPHAAGAQMGIAKLAVSADGDSTHIPATVADGLLVEVSNASIPTGGLTDAELRATPVPVDGPLTDAELRAVPVPVSGTVTTGGLTDAELRATAVPVSGPLTDAQLRAVPVPVSGTVSTGGLTDAELRASPVDVEVAAALPAGTNNIGDVDIASLPNEGQQTMANSISVAVASDQSAIPISDGGGVITVDGTVTANAGTNLNTSALALESGGNLAAAAASLAILDNIVVGNEAQVDVLTMPVVEVVGDVAADVAVPANPLVVGGRASDALPTEVSGDGDSVYQWLLRNGAAVQALIPHLGMLGDPYTQTSETAQYTTTQTSTALVTPGAGQRIAVTSIQIQAGGTTAGTLQVYFGDGAYSRGTSLAIFDGEFAPSATLKPGFAMAPPKPWVGGADEELRVTDSAAINPLTITVWYYLI